MAVDSEMDLPAPDLADVAYGPHPRHRLDLWRPRTPGPWPVVVYIHGGGFRTGDKSSLPPTILHESLQTGLAVAAVNYRLSDTARFPAFMLDAGRAIQFLRFNAAQWNLNPERMAATGGSAGGGISLWLGFHPDLAQPASCDPIARQSTHLTCMGVFNTQCSYDPRFFRREGLAPAAEHPFMQPFYGLTHEQMDTPEAHRLFDEAAPMTWFHAGGPPVFLYYPNDDEPLPDDAQAQRPKRMDELDIPSAPLANRAVHHPKMGKIIRDSLTALGVPCELHLNAAGQIPQVQRKMVEFFTRHLLG